jgi:hypothetical protein
MIPAIFIAGLLPFHCGAEDPPDVGDPPEVLVVPPLDGIDLDTLYATAVQKAITSDMRVPWKGHVAGFDRFTPGCPDVYAGTPSDMIEGIDMDAPGTSWLDHCTVGDLGFGGFEYWESSVHASGDVTTDEGLSIEGQRMLVGDGTISRGDAALFEFKGTASDSLNQQSAPNYEHWLYSSLVDGTVSGSDPFEGAGVSSKGWRTDMYLAYSGGDIDSIEARGNIYWFDEADKIDGRFDSIALDIEFAGPHGITPDDCPTEPRGWIGVRDSDAYWYDVVFEPRHDDDGTDTDYQPDPYTACDGCGTLYVRGVPQDIQVCPDLSFLWDGALAPPDPDEFALSLRDQLEDP